MEWPYSEFKLTLVAVIDPEGGIWFQSLEIDETHSITAGTLQEIKLGELRERIAEAFRDNPALMDFDTLTEQWPTLPARAQTDANKAKLNCLAKRLKKTAPRRGRGANNSDFYREIAELYLELLPEHDQKVIKAMAEILNKPTNTVSGYVRKSREEEWLTDAPAQGRAGGSPGPRLIEYRKENP